jgi:hypothetical protein
MEYVAGGGKHKKLKRQELWSTFVFAEAPAHWGQKQE